MVKGAWSRILVGTGKTRAVLYDARDKAGAGEFGVAIETAADSLHTESCPVHFVKFDEKFQCAQYVHAG